MRFDAGLRCVWPEDLGAARSHGALRVLPVAALRARDPLPLLARPRVPAFARAGLGGGLVVFFFGFVVVLVFFFVVLFAFVFAFGSRDPRFVVAMVKTWTPARVSTTQRR